MLHPFIKTTAASIRNSAKHADLTVEDAMEQLSVSRDVALIAFVHAGVKPKPVLIKRADAND